MKTKWMGVILGLMLLGHVHADQIEWTNTSSFQPLLDRFGNVVPDGTSFLLTLWEDGANNILEDYSTIGSDDFQVASLTASILSGYFYVSFDPVLYGLADGERIYTQIFDAPTIGSSSFFAVVDIGGAIVQDSSTPSPPWTYDTTGTVALDWYVPEPSTITLCGVGLLAMCGKLRQRMKSGRSA